ncbi:hypothetical protein Tco_0442384 [Tanacetum coccineum]
MFEENLVNSFARKRLCIKTNVAGNILENFKVIFKGRVYLVRVKELFAWTPSFIESKDYGYGSDDDLIHGFNNKSGDKRSADVGMDYDSDLEGIAVTEHPYPTHPVLLSKFQHENYNNQAHVQYSVNILDAEKEKSPSVQPNVMNSSQEINDKASSSSASVLNRPRQYRGSVLEVLDDMVRVGQSMGYDMHGCMNDIERIIGSQGDGPVFK